MKKLILQSILFLSIWSTGYSQTGSLFGTDGGGGTSSFNLCVAGTISPVQYYFIGANPFIRFQLNGSGLHYPVNGWGVNKNTLRIVAENGGTISGTNAAGAIVTQSFNASDEITTNAASYSVIGGITYVQFRLNGAPIAGYIIRQDNYSIAFNAVAAPSITPPAPIVCTGGTVNLTANSHTSANWVRTFQWSNGLGTNQVATASAAGAYQVNVSYTRNNNNAGNISQIACVLPLTVNVTLSNISASIDLNGKDFNCIGDNVSLTAMPVGLSYKWNTNPISTSQTINAIATGNYTVTVTNSQNCTATATASLDFQECCEDPCSWSKTGNNNISASNFLGTRNNADLNFGTNGILNMKLGASGHLTIKEGKSLMFGKITNNTTDNRWGIEEFDGGLNFWKPWPTTNSGNYNMFLSNDGKVGIQIGNTPIWGKALGWNWEKFQVRGWGLSDGWATFSDERLKKNFRKIEKPTETLMAIKAYQYDYNTEQFDNQSVKSDKVENKQKMTETIGLTKRYGFKAQEVEKILPDLVHNPTSEEGFKSMDYDGFIPILIEAFKELNAKVEKQNIAVLENDALKVKIVGLEEKLASQDEKFALLEKTITHLCESGCEGLKKSGEGSSSEVDVLYQSIPNPTDSEALINYNLSREYRDAFITVSSQDGKQLMTIKLEAKKGAGSIKLSLGELASGTYLYTLVAGEQVIETKRLQIIK